jgi:hypothetical protein
MWKRGNRPASLFHRQASSSHVFFLPSYFFYMYTELVSSGQRCLWREALTPQRSEPLAEIMQQYGTAGLACCSKILTWLQILLLVDLEPIFTGCECSFVEWMFMDDQPAC